MLAQALAQYADQHLEEELTNKAWEDKPVPLILNLDPAGTFLNVVTNNVAVTRGKKSVSIAAPLSISRSPVSRVAGLHPLLAADDIKYVLGVGPWTKESEKQNHQERHDAFAALIRQAALDTADEGLQAAAAFYSQSDQVAAARSNLPDAKTGSIVALALLNEPIVKRPAVRLYWTNRYNEAAAKRVVGGDEIECLISGKVGPIAPTHEKIKGLASVGGQAAGVSLMSFDKEAFRSYGWEQNANSPVSPDRAMAYVLALNDLLRRDGKQRRDFPGVAFIFWTKHPTDLDPLEMVDQPDPAHVQRLLNLEPDAHPDANMFYMAGLAGNGGRMVVRCWVSETLAQIQLNLKNWFEQLSVLNVYSGTLAEPPKLWQLLYAIDRAGEPPAERSVALLRRALEGQPLGQRMLAAALTRLRVSSAKRLDPARAGLIRLCLNDNIRIRNQGERAMTASLDTAQKHPGYLCGRLMAVYEGLQYSASGEVNQTVADRYFSLASTYPGQAFPKLEDLGKKHLRKLRRVHYGAMVRISQEIDQLHLEIEQTNGFKFPAALDLDSQGRFALGYHHQRAHQMAQAQARKKAKSEVELSEQKQEGVLV